MIPLFTHLPLLAQKLPYVSLGSFPTPVNKPVDLERAVGAGSLFVKRDDLSGEIYGGNKVRKLEFLLGRALRDRAREVMTYGCTGSNHALATALYAYKVGLKSISMLFPQPNALYVRANLLASFRAESELHAYGNIVSAFWGTWFQMLSHRYKTGSFPQRIPIGGSSPLGTVGFVNAAFELKAQIEAGLMPVPDFVYVTLGSMGTAAGLLLGFRGTGMPIRVIAVRVVPDMIANRRGLKSLYRKTNRLLHGQDPSFGEWDFHDEHLEIREEFLGKGYAHFTREAMEAAALAREKEGLLLDGTYTGKTFAALVQDGKQGRLRDKIVLFWDTKSSKDMGMLVGGVDYHNLPEAFHRYFEEEVQPLDAEYSSGGGEK